MKIRLLLILAILTSELPASSGEVESAGMRIIPTPWRFVPHSSRFKVTSSTRIVLGRNTPGEKFAAEQINEELSGSKAAQLKIIAASSVHKLTSNFVFIGGPNSSFGKRLLTERKGILTPQMKEEGYFLDIDADGIVIVAESEKGKFYGVMSLVQMFKREKRSIIVDGASIHDFPQEEVRGITDDISRGQVSTVENFKKIIRFLARYKLNVYSPYIEDMFTFKSYPLIGKERGALTVREVKELDSFAKKFSIDMIPIFETLGHWENILALPEYRDYGEFPGAHTLNVSDERVYEMLDRMIGELAAAFTSPYFNMAADESWDVGLGANKDRVARSDLATVHAEHYKRVAEMIRRHGKKPMMYGDIILNTPAILEKIPKDITIVDWHYGAEYRYPSADVFKTAGFPFIVSPAVWNFTGPFPNYLNSFVNIQNLNRNGFENGSLGLLTSNWNDYGGEAFRELNYYGYAWTAECAWKPLNASSADFNEAFFRDYFGSNGSELPAAYAILSDPANQFQWHELWRHPLLPLRPPDWDQRPPMLLRVQSIESTMPLVISLVKEANDHITRNKDHLPYLEFIARLNLWFARKVRTGEEVKRLSEAAAISTNKDSIGELIIDHCRDVAKDLKAVRSEFERLWLSTNKPSGLEYLLMRYDRQAAYWNEKIEQVKRGEFWVAPTIESMWIMHPRGSESRRDTVQVPKAYFRKAFRSLGGLRSAKVQLIGDTYAILAVNGKSAGGVYARRSLSLIVEHQRVKVFDILPLLNDSLNVISVEVQTFSPNSSAGVNVYCEFTETNGRVYTILSDTSWKTSDLPAVGWNMSAFNDSSWVNAKSYPYPSPVIQPDFATGRTSWIER